MTPSGTLATALRAALRRPLGFFGALVVVLFVLVGATAEQIAPYNPAAMDLAAKLVMPSEAHWLGADQLGRDVLSRVIYGTRISMIVAFVSILLSVSLGTLLGMIAAYGSRWIDTALIFLFDTIRSVPTVMFGLAVAALFGPSIPAIIAVVVATTCPSYARLVRTQVMSLRNAEFIMAERAMGAGLPRILLHHTLPNIIGPVLIVASMDIPFVIAIETSLSFLGLGVRPPNPSWGSILNDGFSFIRNTPWVLVAGGLPLVLTTIGFTFLGETLRDALDPRLRGELR
jgi:peptide/nickel transport system permease protein